MKAIRYTVSLTVTTPWEEADECYDAGPRLGKDDLLRQLRAAVRPIDGDCDYEILDTETLDE